MEYKVKETGDGKVLIDDSPEIKAGEAMLTHKGLEVATYSGFSFHKGSEFCFKIIATIGFSIDKDVPMVIVEDEVKKSLENHYSDGTADERIAFLLGYKAREQKGVYSEEDLRSAIQFGENLQISPLTYNVGNTPRDNFVLSLKKEYIDLEMETILYPANLPKENEKRPPYRIKTDRIEGQLMAFVKKMP